MTLPKWLVVFVWIVLIAVIVAIFIDNIHMRKRVYVDYENYRTEMHHCITEALEADNETASPYIGLIRIMRAQDRVRGMANLVNGPENLSRLSGFDVNKLLNTMTLSERQIRAALHNGNTFSGTSSPKPQEEPGVLLRATFEEH